MAVSVQDRSVRQFPGDDGLGTWLQGAGNRVPRGDRLTQALDRWAGVDLLPNVLLFDEVVALIGDTRISRLRHLSSPISTA